MLHGAAQHLEALQQRYPIGNNPLFPGKRIYQDGSRYWDLTGLKLQVWSTSIVSCIFLVIINGMLIL